jgi:hypothetical protein
MKFSLIFALYIVVWIAMFPVSPGSAAEMTGFGPVDHIWWRMTGQERTRDNGVVTSYELIFSRSRDDMKLSDVEMVFISTKLDGTGEKISDVYTKNLYEIDGKYRVDIYSGENEQIALLAKARTGEKQLYARTLLRGYGQSGKTDPEATRIDTILNWPKLRLANEEYFFRAQAGTPLNVHIENARAIHIFENNTFIGTLTPDDTGFYTHTPPHDKELSRAGFSAKNDLVLVAALENGSVAVSLYLPVYRAFYGRVSLKGGLGVTAASALFCLASVLYRGRRFRWK